MNNINDPESAFSNNNENYTISVIGLGLIGGSLAMALKGYKNAKIIAVDIDSQTREDAIKSRVVDIAYDSPQQEVFKSDLIILCVYPHHIKEFFEQYADKLQNGCVVTDVCGTKEKLYDELKPLIPEHIRYIGVHPMAGKEVDGFENACADLFVNTGFLITPLPISTEEDIEEMRALGKAIGATRIAVSEPELHDDIIGYTSDLMHISATALCMHYHPDMTSAYTAGAFRDCTRIANINPDLWTELLLTNADKTLPHLDTYIDFLMKMQNALRQNDAKTLYELLELAGTNKKEMLDR